MGHESTIKNTTSSLGQLISSYSPLGQPPSYFYIEIKIHPVPLGYPVHNQKQAEKALKITLEDQAKPKLTLLLNDEHNFKS